MEEPSGPFSVVAAELWTGQVVPGPQPWGRAAGVSPPTSDGTPAIAARRAPNAGAAGGSLVQRIQITSVLGGHEGVRSKPVGPYATRTALSQEARWGGQRPHGGAAGATADCNTRLLGG